MVARLQNLNLENKIWSKHSWWEGIVWGNYEACGQCGGDNGREFIEEQPELCKCNGALTIETRTRVTANWMRKMRTLDWERRTKWDPLDHGRTITSTTALPEDMHNYQVPMFILGSDVVSLYPNLDTVLVEERVREAVIDSKIKWEGVDYREGVRYIALNWTEEMCRRSRLRRVLPWRRKRNGTRPGIRGQGPKGPEKGDTEQWIFPRVTLTEEEKKEIVATVIKIAVGAMFEHHYYSFKGKIFKQLKGGPIGLRGTCAIARLCMRIFDVKWEEILRTHGINVELVVRYMDYGRAYVPSETWFEMGWWTSTILYSMEA